jgi:hypothetical protein
MRTRKWAERGGTNRLSQRSEKGEKKKRTVPTTVGVGGWRGGKEPPMRDQNAQGRGGNKRRRRRGAEKDSRDKQGPERRQDKKGGPEAAASARK